MAIKELQFLFNKLPFYIVFYPTSRCNTRCSHCYNYLRQSSATEDNELSLTEIKKISSNFGHIKALTISGGEPFLRDDLQEIISIFYKNNALQYVSFHTNAFLGKRVVQTVSDILKSLKDLIIIVCVSIDGIGEDHDRIRGVPGGFDKMCQTVEELEKLKKTFNNLYLISSTIYGQSTQESFQKTIDFIKGRFKTIKPSPCFIRGEVRSSKEKEVDIRQYKEFLERSYKTIDQSIKPFSFMALKGTIDWMTHEIVLQNYLNEVQTIPCQAGRKLVVIYENGDVHPCELSSEKFGNLRDVDYDIKKLLFSKNGESIKKKIYPDKVCHCTWENIISANLVFDIKSYPKIFYHWYRLFVSSQEGRKKATF
jgi:MoaA/NifB/PqqE/SkfB family radical SAM enzyme